MDVSSMPILAIFAIAVVGSVNSFEGVVLPKTVVVNEGETLEIPVTITGHDVSGVTWAEKHNGQFEDILYMWSKGSDKPVLTKPSWRSHKDDMSRYSLDGYNLVIANFSDEDCREKCVVFFIAGYTYSGNQENMFTCTNITYNANTFEGVTLPKTIFAKEGETLVIPVTITGHTVSGISWAERQNGHFEDIYMSHLGDEHNYKPSWRPENDDMSRYSLDGYNLVIANFGYEDRRDKCVSFFIVGYEYGDKIEDAFTCTLILYHGTATGSDPGSSLNDMESDDFSAKANTKLGKSNEDPQQTDYTEAAIGGSVVGAVVLIAIVAVLAGISHRSRNKAVKL